MRTELDISASFCEDIRLRIILLLKDASLCVKCLVASLDSLQPNVSRHLSILRKNGIVGKIRMGGRSYYSLDFNGEYGKLKRELVTAYCNELTGNEPYKSDRKTLINISSECEADCALTKMNKRKKTHRC